MPACLACLSHVFLLVLDSLFSFFVFRPLSRSMRQRVCSCGNSYSVLFRSLSVTVSLSVCLPLCLSLSVSLCYLSPSPARLPSPSLSKPERNSNWALEIITRKETQKKKGTNVQPYDWSRMCIYSRVGIGALNWLHSIIRLDDCREIAASGQCLSSLMSLWKYLMRKHCRFCFYSCCSRFFLMSWKSVIALIFVLCERSANMDKNSRSTK